MINITIPLSEVKLTECDFYKYVRLESNEFRFCGVGNAHSDMVEKDEKAISAGQIGVRKDAFKFFSYGSQTLEVKWLDTDEAELEKLLDKICVGKGM